MKSLQTPQRARSGSPAGRTLLWLAMLLFVSSAHGTALAAEIVGGSRTYMQFRETAAGNTLMPIYEYLNLSVRDIGAGSVSFHMGGWLRYDLKDDSFGKDSNSDLQYAYLSYRHGSSNAAVNLGRIMVFEGVAAERLDGVYARTDLRAGFGVSAFGGAPVMTNEGDDSGASSIYGARISHQKDNLYIIGLSALQQEKNSHDFRDEQGLDLWVRPVRLVELMGRSTYNDRLDGWMQHAYTLLLGPFGKLKVNAEASRVNYEYFFDGATNNAFTFSPAGPVDPKEKLDILGATLSYPLTERMTLSVERRQYDYAVAGSADAVGAGLRYSLPGEMAAGGSVRRMDGETERLRYDEYRVYGYKKYGRLDVTVDLLEVAYDAAINGETSARSASLGAGYDLTEKLRLGADVQYGRNPDFDREVRGFVKLIYQFQFAAGKGKGV